MSTATATAATPTKARTINGLKPGESVELLFSGKKSFRLQPWRETFVFLGFTGEGENREARFCGSTGNTWEAYRLKGRWCHGSIAEPLSVHKG